MSKVWLNTGPKDKTSNFPNCFNEMIWNDLKPIRIKFSSFHQLILDHRLYENNFMKLKKHKDLNSTSQIFWLHILVEGKYSSRKRKQCSSLPPFSLFFAKKSWRGVVPVLTLNYYWHILTQLVFTGKQLKVVWSL